MLTTSFILTDNDESALITAYNATGKLAEAKTIESFCNITGLGRLTVRR